MYQVTVRHNKIDQTKARRIARSEEKWRFDNESHFLLFTYVLNSVAPFKYQQRHLERNCIYKQRLSECDEREFMNGIVHTWNHNGALSGDF